MTEPVLAVTPGEPAGIGPEILLRLLAEHPEFRILSVADPELIRQTGERLGLEIPVIEWSEGMPVTGGELACFPVPLGRAARPGRPDPRNAKYVLETLQHAVRLVRSGTASALVTGPVHKGVINDGGYAFTGHTEYLAELSDTPRVVMMLAAPGLRVTLVTTHLPLGSVADAIDAENLEAVIRITWQELHTRFGIDNPRLQILGLNPHAGEGGHLGNEEIQIIGPVIERLRGEGMRLQGPVPADTAFTPPRLEACDAVVAMYHDQGLPVLKHMGFGKSVNITLGLPFIRTSVDHGTALDIAESGVASAESLYHAALAAQELISRRRT